MIALKPVLFVTGAIVILSSSAQAADQTFTSSYLAVTSFTAQPTAPAVSQFDPALGTLTGITYTFTTTVNGDAKAESLDASASTVVETLGATVSLLLGATVLATEAPSASVTHNFTAYDGVNDFGGTSGATDLSLGGTQTMSGTISAFTPYIGKGTVPFAISASGSSTATGAGNLITQFLTNAGGTVSLTYTYTPAVIPPVLPEPGSLALVGASLAGLGLVRRRAR